MGHEQDVGGDLSTTTASHCRAESTGLYSYPQMVWQSWCPHCKSHRITPYYRRSLLERVLALMIVPYRCTRCDLTCLKFRGTVHSR
jgi:hypothetical protein